MSNKKKKRRKKRHVILPFVILLFVILIAGVIIGGYLYVKNMYSMATFETLPEYEQAVSQALEKLGENPVEDEEGDAPVDEEGNTLEELSANEVNVLHEEMVAHVESLASSGLQDSSDVTNLLLIGVDRRDASWEGNSDAMILLSINRETSKIVMTSLLRDTYCYIPGVGNYKLNYAMALGGAGLLVPTVEANFGIDIDYYAEVDFNAFVACVDALGGVGVTVSEEEATVMNDYIREYNELNGIPSASGFVQGGTSWLSGKQALGYVRVRYVGNGDFTRTQRQRTVILALLDQLKAQGLTSLTNVANSVLPYLTHNISETELWGLVAEAPSFLNYQVVQESFPYDGAYSYLNINGDSYIAPDWANCLSRLQATINQ